MTTINVLGFFIIFCIRTRTGNRVILNDLLHLCNFLQNETEKHTKPQDSIRSHKRTHKITRKYKKSLDNMYLVRFTRENSYFIVSLITINPNFLMSIIV